MKEADGLKLNLKNRIMNLETLKNTYAQEHGYDDWEQLVIINELHSDRLDKYWTEICIRAQKLALEKAAKNVKMGYTSIFSDDMKLVVDRKSITNPENLIR